MQRQGIAHRDYNAAACETSNKEASLRNGIHNYASYGADYRSPIERKAVVGGMLAIPDKYPTLFDPGKPLSEKAYLLLSRLYRSSPKVVQYLTAIANRPPKC